MATIHSVIVTFVAGDTKHRQVLGIVVGPVSIQMRPFQPVDGAIMTALLAEGGGVASPFHEPYMTSIDVSEVCFFERPSNVPLGLTIADRDAIRLWDISSHFVAPVHDQNIPDAEIRDFYESPSSEMPMTG
jgi:hypothetical protein